MVYISIIMCLLTARNGSLPMNFWKYCSLFYQPIFPAKFQTCSKIYMLCYIKSVKLRMGTVKCGSSLPKCIQPLSCSFLNEYWGFLLPSSPFCVVLFPWIVKLIITKFCSIVVLLMRDWWITFLHGRFCRNYYITAIIFTFISLSSCIFLSN